MKTIKFTVEGMHCDGCAERLQRLLEKTPGVREAPVSFADGVARVRYNPRTVSGARLVGVIEGSGFSVPTRLS